MTPEVFAMLDAGVSAIILLAVTVKRQKRVIRWFIRGICLLFPLTILHHTMAILLVPSVFWLILPSLRLVKSLREWVFLAASFCIGLLPLLYIPVATLRGSSPILWDNPTTMARIVRLLTRADYGSFMSGSTVGHSLYERLLTVKSYGIFFF